MAESEKKKQWKKKLRIGLLISGMIAFCVVCTEWVMFGNYWSIFDALDMKLYTNNQYVWDAINGIHAISLLVFFFSIYLAVPFVLTVINMVLLLVKPKKAGVKQLEVWVECITIVWGCICSYYYVQFEEPYILFDKDWSQVIYTNQTHTPIWTEAYPTVLVLACIGFIGYLILIACRTDKTPPLITVLAMAAMYSGLLEMLLAFVQVQTSRYLLLAVLPFNCLIIGAKTIWRKIREWNAMPMHKERDFEKKSCQAFLAGKLNKAEYWPLVAFVLMWPLLGIVLGVLMLFGQKPDYVIKAWTETAEWTLSQREAPPKVTFDEHYLCTVAAGGHDRIVKPIRMGVRHGHKVVVNRQLCVANAFEQILEERTPKFHKVVRHIYDTCGFPIARLIRTRLAADVVYVIMKPLEWLFVTVIYLCDVKPENRIAVQYLPKKVEKINEK